MIYRKLGRTGIEVGAIALGCEGFVGKTDAEARAMMDFAIGNGVNFIDIYASDPAALPATAILTGLLRQMFPVQKRHQKTLLEGESPASRGVFQHGKCRTEPRCSRRRDHSKRCG